MKKHQHTNGTAVRFESEPHTVGMDAPTRENDPIGRFTATGADARMRKRVEALKQQRDELQRQIDHYEFVMADLYASRTTDKGAAVETMIRKAVVMDGARRQSVDENLTAALAALPDDTPIRVKAISEQVGHSVSSITGYLNAHKYRKTGEGVNVRWFKPGTTTGGATTKATTYGALADAIRTAIESLPADTAVHARTIADQLQCSPTSVLNYLKKHKYRSAGSAEKARWFRPGQKATVPPPKLDIPKQRQRSAKMLAQFSTTTPRPIVGGAKIGVFLRHGYLAKRGTGYVRTSKAFDATA